MNKVLISVFIIISLSKTSFAQSFLGAFSLGANLSQVDGDEIYGFKKIGLNMGVAAFYPIIQNKLYGSVEISYSQKGAYQKYPLIADPASSLPYYSLYLNYLDIPFLIHLMDKRSLMLGTGISYGRLVGMKEIEWGIIKNNSVFESPYIREDWNFIVDVRIPIHNRFKFNFRYNYSLKKLRTRTYTNISGDEWNRDQFNNFLSFRLVYVFNEKIKPKNND